LTRLIAGNHYASHKASEYQRRGADCKTVPPQEFPRAIGKRIVPRSDWSTAQITNNIGGKLLYGLVAARGFLSHRHQNDIVEIAIQSPRGRTRPRRLSPTNNAIDLRLCVGIDLLSARSGEDLVQYRAECIYVADGRDGQSADLLGTRV